MFNTKALYGTLALFALTYSAFSAPAYATSIPFADDFSTIASSQLNTAPTNWTVSSGSVDSIFKTNSFGISCYNGSNGCVDLDGSGAGGGTLLVTSPFTLVAGQTYQIDAVLSGNQRGGLNDTVTFGFKDSSLTTLKDNGGVSLAPTDPFALFTLLYTPGVTQLASLFFQNDGSDGLGAILGKVSVKNISAVPLPASAWLLLSGLAALVVVSRRRVALR